MRVKLVVFPFSTLPGSMDIKGLTPADHSRIRAYLDKPSHCRRIEDLIPDGELDES